MTSGAFSNREAAGAGGTSSALVSVVPWSTLRLRTLVAAEIEEKLTAELQVRILKMTVPWVSSDAIGASRLHALF